MEVETETETEYDYDLFVIGGGSGGISAAKKASKLGAKVAIADFVNPTPQGIKWGLGGTCVNVGCIPKKLMHFTSLLGESKQDQVSSGWEIDVDAKHNWSKMLAMINTHIKRLNWGYKKQMLELGIKYFNCFATFKDAHTISLVNRKGKETIVRADKIVISVGGKPIYLNIPNIKEIAITSDDIFWRKRAPGKTLIIGGGYIAMECAGFLSGIGNEVEILIRSVVLKKFDRDMISRITQDMKNKGIKFTVGTLESIEEKENVITTVQKVKLNSDIVTGNAIENTEIEEDLVTNTYETVILAIGRSPLTLNIGLKELGVNFSPNGKIPVNEDFQTNIPNLFAIGDIRSGSPELTPVAIKEGIILSNNLYNKENFKMRKINYNAVATTIYSPLEYSKVGLNEQEAIQKYGEENIEIYHSSFKPLEWNFCQSRENNLCYCKIIVTRGNEEIILGIHYAGPNAGEVMQGYSLALLKKTTFEDFKDISKIL